MRRAAFTLLALVIGLCVASLALEAGVRLVIGEQPKFPRRVVGAPWGLRINEPNAVYRHKSADTTVWFRINGQGLRADRDFARAKPPGVKRIVSLGDSFTVGYEVEGEETFSSVLERGLRARGRNVEVLNAGVSGFSNAEECLYLERELLAYQPDLVLVSFFVNDLVDNQRADLFRLEDGRLVEAARDYVPGGRLGNFLNTNPFFSWLAGYSDAFAMAKEVATQVAKRRMVEANVAQLDAAAGEAGAAEQEHAAAARRLAAAIFERIWRVSRDAGATLVVQSIPSPVPLEHPTELVDAFPAAEFALDRPGFAYFSAKAALEPALGGEPLYWTRSHGHWTPLAHRLAGEGLAELIVARGFLDDSAPAAE